MGAKGQDGASADGPSALSRRGGRQAVVVTGVGVVSALATDPEGFWRALREGRGGIGPVSRFATDRFRCTLAAQCDEDAIRLPPGPYSFDISRMSLFVRLALFAAHQALADGDCGVDEARFIPRLPGRGRTYLGVAMGGLPNIEAGVHRQENRGVRKTYPYLIPSLIPNMAASMIALRHDLEGPQHTIAGACAAGAQALGEAVHAVGRGDCDWALAGGSEAVTTPITYSGFEAMAAVSLRSDPGQAPRPFDSARDGFVPGEAAAVFLIESLDHARARGRRGYGSLLGYATNSGGDVLTEISEARTADCMAEALGDAGLAPRDVDMVFAQASGSVGGDPNESRALARVFAANAGLRGRSFATPPVTSIKGHTGYAFAANGPLGVLAALGALRAGEVPAVRNLTAPEPACGSVDFVRETREVDGEIALVNAFGFGGVNASLIVGR